MGDAGRFDRADLLQRQVADVIQQALSTTQQDRHDVQLHLVDEAGREVLPRDVRSTAELYVLAPAASFAWSRADSIPSVTKLKVVSGGSSGSRSWWVSTKTG